MEIWILSFFFSALFWFFFLRGKWRHQNKKWIKKHSKHTIYIFRTEAAKSSHFIIGIASIPVSRYSSSPGKLWKCWRGGLSRECMGCAFLVYPKIMPLLQNLYIPQEDLSSIDIFCFGDRQGLSDSCLSFFPPQWAPAPWQARASSIQPFILQSHLSSGGRDTGACCSHFSCFTFSGSLWGCSQKPTQLCL